MRGEEMVGERRDSYWREEKETEKDGRGYKGEEERRGKESRGEGSKGRGGVCF